MLHYHVSSTPSHVAQYVSNIPAEWKSKTVTAFAIGFVTRSITAENPIAGLVGGSACAIATLIHTAITPFFKQVLGDIEYLSWDQEMIRSGIALISTASILYACGDKKVFEAIFFDALIFMIRAMNESGRSLKVAQTMFAMPTMNFFPKLA